MYYSAMQTPAKRSAGTPRIVNSIPGDCALTNDPHGPDPRECGWELAHKTESVLSVGQPLTDSGNDACGILVIDFAQHVVGQPDSVDPPESLGWKLFLGIRKIFVESLQKTPIETQSLLGPRAIGSEENPI